MNCTRYRFGMAAFVAVLLLLVAMPDFVQACPTCKGALHDNPNLAYGYYWSILFMMSMPFILFAAWAIYIFRVMQQMRADAVDPLPGELQV